MRLVKILTVLIIIHMAFGFTQVVVSYYTGDVADHGTAGWFSHTPLGTFIDLDQTPQAGSDQASPSRIRETWDFVLDLGATINSLASFGYGFWDLIQPDSLVYQVVVVMRIASYLFTVGLGLALLYVLFDSGLLTSKLALGLVAGAAGVTAALSGAAALFGG